MFLQPWAALGAHQLGTLCALCVLCLLLLLLLLTLCALCLLRLLCADAKAHWAIHRDAPPFVEQSTEQEILTTGIKVSHPVVIWLVITRPGCCSWALELPCATGAHSSANGMQQLVAKPLYAHKKSAAAANAACFECKS